MSGRIEVIPGQSSGQWHFTVTHDALTPAGAAQGGALMAALVDATERTTGRGIVWATGRYLRHAALDARLDITVTTDVAGHSTTQSSAVGTVDGLEVISVWAASGSRDFPETGTWIDAPPGLTARPEAPRIRIAGPEPTMADNFDLRLAAGRMPEELDGTPGTGRTALWFTLPGGPRPITAADIAVIADFAMLAGSDAFGRRCTGNSLDNTIRIVDRATVEHVVLETRLVAASGGFGQLESRVWTAEGRLLAVAGTSLVLRLAGSDGRSDRRTRRIVGGSEADRSGTGRS